MLRDVGRHQFVEDPKVAPPEPVLDDPPRAPGEIVLRHRALLHISIECHSIQIECYFIDMSEDVNVPDHDPVRPSLRAERAAVTRRRILEAAHVRFAADGYGATTLQAIADEAGVAVQTVYAVWGSKAGILRALREALARQPEAELLYDAALAMPRAADALALFARSIRARWEEGADIVRIHAEAAASDASLREEVGHVLARRRAGLRRLVEAVAGSLRAGLDVERASAIVDALTLPEVYLELTRVGGWSADEYEAWLSVALVSELLPREA